MKCKEEEEVEGQWRAGRDVRDKQTSVQGKAKVQQCYHSDLIRVTCANIISLISLIFMVLIKLQ